MDPYIANLNLDPPSRSSELLKGVLPALLLNLVFFGIVLLGMGPGDPPMGEGNAPATREMGGPPAAAAPPVQEQPAPAPTASVQPAVAPMSTGTPTPAATPAPAPAQAAAVPASAPSPAPAPVPAATTAPPTRVARIDPQPVAPARAEAPPPRVSPSFDCTRARLKTDRMICADPELSQLDRDLGRLYAQAKASAPDPAAFKRQNDREWLRRESECRDKACLQRWYAERRSQLQARLEGRRQATGSPTR